MEETVNMRADWRSCDSCGCLYSGGKRGETVGVGTGCDIIAGCTTLVGCALIGCVVVGCTELVIRSRSKRRSGTGGSR